MGYEPFLKPCDVKVQEFESERNLGRIPLTPSNIQIEGVTVSATAVPVKVKKDTIEYNANAYRKQRARMLEGKSVNYEDYREGFERFKANFTVPQEMLDMLRQKAVEAKIEVTDSAFQASLPMLTLQLKAYIARDLFDMSEYFEIINPTNEIYQRGLEAIKDENNFQNIKTK